jgi:AraC family transcriptional regulator
MPRAPKAPLQEKSLFSAQAFRHYGRAEHPLLSVKSMFNGRAIYTVGRARFAVEERGYLVLNDNQAYEIEINSPTKVESFIVYFPHGWAADVLRALTTPTDRLFDLPDKDDTPPVHFFERFSPDDDFVSPELRRLRRAHNRGAIANGVLEELLRGLLVSMLKAQRSQVREMEGLNALRLSTRQELWRRLNRGRDFIRAGFENALNLQDMAAAASLSPFHFLRVFKSAFGISPHQFLSACRMERAKFLLERTDMPVTDVCLAIGFESLGTFSSSFRRHNGVSPREWKKARSKK